MRPRTASARDAMLRTAAEAAVDAAMEQSGAQLGGMPPAALITGLAGDLGEPFRLCPSMIRAERPAATGIPSCPLIQHLGARLCYSALCCH